MNKPQVFRYEVKAKKPSDLGHWRTAATVMAKSETLAVEVFKFMRQEIKEVIVSVVLDIEIDMQTARCELFGKSERHFLPEYFA